MQGRFKRIGGASVLMALIAATLLLMVPGTGSAVCVPSSPTPQPGANTTVLALPDGGKAWFTNPSGSLNGETGANGPRGFIRASGNASTMSGEIRGHSTNAPINGRISGSASSGVSFCISVAGTDVKYP